MSNTLTLSPRTVLETRAQFAHRRSAGAADRSDRAGGGDCRRGVVRHELGQPDAPRQPRSIKWSTTCRIRRARTRCGSASTCSTTTTRSPIPRSARGATRSRRSRISSPASTTTPASRRRSACHEVSQTNPNLGVLRAGRVEGQIHASRSTSGVRYDLQFLETIDTDTRQRLAARRLRLVAVRLAPHDRPRQRRPVLRSRAAARGRQRAAVRRQHHRSGEPAPDQRQPVAGAGRRAGVSRTSCRRGARRSRCRT